MIVASDALGLIGMECGAAKQKAEDNGLTAVSCQTGDPAPSAAPISRAPAAAPSAAEFYVRRKIPGKLLRRT